MTKPKNPQPLTTTETHYDEIADKLADIYNGLEPERVHAAFLPYLKGGGKRVLDVGAHSGRDAAWLADMGHVVDAVEPSRACLAKAAETCRGKNVGLIRDALPKLARLQYREGTYDLILLSAVWMHVPPAQRKASLNRLKELLAPGGKILISLRHGTPDPARKMYEVSQEEITRLVGARYGVASPEDPNVRDEQGRADVWWSYLVLTDPRKPKAAATPPEPKPGGGAPRL